MNPYESGSVVDMNAGHKTKAPAAVAVPSDVVRQAIKKLHMLLMPVPAPEMTALEVCKVVSERAIEIIGILQAAPSRESPNTLTETAPARIWLQVDPQGTPVDSAERFPADTGGVTWCADDVGGAQVEYARADLAAPQPAAQGDALDAERYRWLRITPGWDVLHRLFALRDAALDEAIDAARAKEGASNAN